MSQSLKKKKIQDQAQLDQSSFKFWSKLATRDSRVNIIFCISGLGNQRETKTQIL